MKHEMKHFYGMWPFGKALHALLQYMQQTHQLRFQKLVEIHSG